MIVGGLNELKRNPLISTTDLLMIFHCLIAVWEVSVLTTKEEFELVQFTRKIAILRMS